ncbi:MAG: tetratricopeptide repeat protein [Pseudomonadota bacterium]
MSFINEMNTRGYSRFCSIACNVGLLIAVTFFLQGCGVKHAVVWPSGPAPVSRPEPMPAPRPAPVPAPAPTPVPVPDAAQDSVPVAEEGKAAGTLLAGARQNVRTGRFSQAEMMLERALRLEPRNARLWHEMAQVKYGQKDFGQVVQFCIKSNSLAGKDYGLIQQNRLLMEKAYMELGQPEKARQARIKSG